MDALNRRYSCSLSDTERDRLLVAVADVVLRLSIETFPLAAVRRGTNINDLMAVESIGRLSNALNAVKLQESPIVGTLILPNRRTPNHLSAAPITANGHRPRRPAGWLFFFLDGLQSDAIIYRRQSSLEKNSLFSPGIHFFLRMGLIPILKSAIVVPSAQ
jgi:hypothetical protein